MSNALQRLEEDYAILARGPHTHDCILELAGVCPICESYMDMREEIGEMIREERALRIVALAMLIPKENGQRETAADLR
jgi:hypothetical protein